LCGDTLCSFWCEIGCGTGIGIDESRIGIGVGNDWPTKQGSPGNCGRRPLSINGGGFVGGFEFGFKWVFEFVFDVWGVLE